MAIRGTAGFGAGLLDLMSWAVSQAPLAQQLGGAAELSELLLPPADLFPGSQCL